MVQRNKNGLPSEDQEQSWLAAWFRNTYPDLRMFAIPNGGLRTKTQAAIFKATGVCSGVPDLMVPVPRGGYNGLFVEMKTQDGGRVDKEQKEWKTYLESMGYKSIICNGFEVAKQEITCYLALSIKTM